MKFILRKQGRVKRLTIVFLVFNFLFVPLFYFFVVRQAQSATRTWDGEGTEVACPGNADGWSCAQNWSTDTVPTSADIAAFDNTSDKDATIDASFAGSVQGVDINAGYDGTITQSRSLTVGSSSFDQASGTWNGGSQTFDVNENFIVSGGVHNATTGTWTIVNNFTHSGGTLSAASSTPTFDSSSSFDDSTFTCSGTFSGTVDIATASFGADFTLANGCTINLVTNIAAMGGIINNGAMNGTNMSLRTDFTNTGTIDLSGSLSFSGTSSFDDSTLTCSGTFSETVDITKTSTGAIFTLANGCTATLATNIDTGAAIVNNGTMNATNINIESDFTQAGTLNLSGTIDFDGTGSGSDSILTCTGTFPADVDVSKGSVSASFTVSSNCTANLVASIDTMGLIINSGTLNGTTINTEGDFTNSGTVNISGTLTLDGTGSTSDSDLNCGSGTIQNLVINKTSSGGDTTLTGNCTIAGNFTRTDGPVINPAAARTLIVQGNFSMSTTDNYGGSNMTTEFGGTANQTITRNAGTLSGPVRINKTAGHVTQSSSLTLDSLTISDGEFRNSGQTLTVTNGLTVNDTLTQGAANITLGTLTVGASGTYANSSTGDIIVGAGGVANSGTMNLGVEGSCPGTDNISITSSSGGAQRSWTGAGTFNFYDLSVQDQGGSAEINAFSSTSVSGNDNNWTFYEGCEIPLMDITVGSKVNIRSGTSIRRQ